MLLLKTWGGGADDLLSDHDDIRVTISSKAEQFQHAISIAEMRCLGKQLLSSVMVTSGWWKRAHAIARTAESPDLMSGGVVIEAIDS